MNKAPAPSAQTPNQVKFVRSSRHIRIYFVRNWAPRRSSFCGRDGAGRVLSVLGRPGVLPLRRADAGSTGTPPSLLTPKQIKGAPNFRFIYSSRRHVDIDRWCIQVLHLIPIRRHYIRLFGVIVTFWREKLCIKRIVFFCTAEFKNIGHAEMLSNLILPL